MPLNFSSLFPSGREAFINFSWSDVANATGYVIYECFNAKNSVGDVLLLSPSTLINNMISSGAEAVSVSAHTFSTSAVKVLDKDFNASTFKSNRYID